MTITWQKVLAFIALLLAVASLVGFGPGYLVAIAVLLLAVAMLG